VILAYKTLHDEKIVDRSWPEDKITRELCVRIHIHSVKNGTGAIPVHQYPIFPKVPKKGRPPTIDFVFRRGYEELSYLAFECKIVDDKEDHSIQEYVNEGIMRFLSGKYSRNEKLGGMVAYLINSEIAECVRKINELVENKLGKTDCLSKASITFNFDGVYQSIHNRAIFLDLFLLYHIFMTFND